ncbi:PTS sugar transporter subunit IIA [Dermabacter hominis]|uniref:PTS sugar transporter subunit IIA n=1 Tax=Dermabacter hominis TaxID=36740 RepID=UPI0021A5F3C0|nr:PTS sugar transporter subunit IIA [Dermabacter hominis]MDU4693933.1 PTS sugar transporter subunit IIA [Dermabacter sp.]MCT2056686.1 PTS sugar transporter subunit IIA [Dermabacter hominis]MCT2084319.1 PTS sugar transporter subunit IIA [Dermabacter hominis]MCT2091512.1 PTS sugar transporter subunit IIA [Dermabacter hominis]MCT2191119.1 PTS sugar transporter subunit IIA [Dermabacter hominis]
MSFGIVPGAAFARLEAESDREVLTTMARRLRELGAVAATFEEAVIAREERFPTGLPTAVPTALPHTDPEHVLIEGVAVATLAHPVQFREMGSSSSSIEARFVVMMLLKQAHSQLEALQTLVARLQDVEAVEALASAVSDEDLFAAASDWLAAGGA